MQTNLLHIPRGISFFAPLFFCAFLFCVGVMLASRLTDYFFPLQNSCVNVMYKEEPAKW